MFSLFQGSSGGKEYLASVGFRLLITFLSKKFILPCTRSLKPTFPGVRLALPPCAVLWCTGESRLSRMVKSLDAEVPSLGSKSQLYTHQPCICSKLMKPFVLHFSCLSSMHNNGTCLTPVVWKLKWVTVSQAPQNPSCYKESKLSVNGSCSWCYCYYGVTHLFGKLEESYQIDFTFLTGCNVQSKNTVSVLEVL